MGYATREQMLDRVMSLRRIGVPVAVAAILSVLAVGLLHAATTPAFDATAVENAALTAVETQYTAAQSPDPAGVHALFSGPALAMVSTMRANVQAEISNGSDYPGPVEVSDVQVENIQGSATSAVLDVALHAKLSNMKAGQVVDYSQSDLIYHFDLVLAGASWMVSDMEWTFAPGGGP